MQLRCTSDLASESGPDKNGANLGSAPAQYTRKPMSRSAVAEITSSEAPGAARSIASGAGSHPGAGRDACRDVIEYGLAPGQQCHVEAAPGWLLGHRRAYPVEAPATSAHGPYLSANCIDISLDSCDSDRGELPSCDAPTAGGAHQFVIVETDCVDAGVVVGSHDQSIDIGPRRGRIAIDGDGVVAQPVHGVPGDRVDRSMNSVTASTPFHAPIWP